MKNISVERSVVCIPIWSMSFGRRKTQTTMNPIMRPIGLLSSPIAENGSLFCIPTKYTQINVTAAQHIDYGSLQAIQVHNWRPLQQVLHNHWGNSCTGSDGKLLPELMQITSYQFWFGENSPHSSTPPGVAPKPMSQAGCGQSPQGWHAPALGALNSHPL